MKMELIDGTETSAIINQTLGNYPKGNLLYSVHGESLKSRRINIHKRNIQTIRNTVDTSTHITKTPTQLSKHSHITKPINKYIHPHVTKLTAGYAVLSTFGTCTSVARCLSIWRTVNAI